MSDFPMRAGNVKTLLMGLAKEDGDNLEWAIVIGRSKDGSNLVATNEINSDFLAKASFILQDLTLMSINGDIDEE